MCTVTVLPRSHLLASPSSNRLLLRVACNRDELVTRAPALPPTLWTAGTRRALMPIDPESGGSWIAANDSGLVFVLLNANPHTLVRAGEISRGTIIPTLVSSATASHAVTVAQRLQAGRFAPFRLLIIDPQAFVECWPEGDRIRHRRSALQTPILRTSSGLGDKTAAGPRRTLFQRMFIGPPDARDAQDDFHRHEWPGREAISVKMTRREARTVSHTLVEVRDGSVRMSYRAIDWPHAIAVQVAA